MKIWEKPRNNAKKPTQNRIKATLLYRLAAYWLPIPAGGVAYLLFRRRYH